MVYISCRKLSPQKLTMLLVISVFCSLLVTGCSKEIQEVKSEDINLQTVKAVLEKEFTGPDKEYTRLWEKDGQEKFEEIGSYLSVKYKPYFTENGLDHFITGPAYKYHFPDADYQMSVEELVVKQNENINASNRYDFTVQVGIVSPSEEKMLYEVYGTAYFSEERKISKIQITARNHLLKEKLNELMNLN